MPTWEITTPEAIPLRLRPAGIGQRLIAALVDLVIITLFGIGIASLLCIFLPSSLGPAISILILAVVFWLYPVWCESRNRGCTLGKSWLSLRVVDDRGLPLTGLQCLVRSLLRLIDILPCGGIGLITILSNRHGRRLGDLAAGTLVIDERPIKQDLSRLEGKLRHNSLDEPAIRLALRHRMGLEEREFLLSLALVQGNLEAQARHELLANTAAWLRSRLNTCQLPDLPDETLVRDLTALVHSHALDETHAVRSVGGQIVKAL